MNTYFDNGVVKLYRADARDLSFLEPGTVDCCITSPPYWGLRDYGLEPSVWDAVDGCEHEWDGELPHGRRGNRGVSGTGGNLHPALDAVGQGAGSGTSGAFCLRCGAWRGTLGLEPTPELYVQHLVEIFREVKRVLKPMGTVWLNLGDSYATTPTGSYGTKSGLHGAQTSEKYKATIRDVYTKKANTITSGLKPKDLCMMPARVALALQADGWWLRSDIIWAKPNPMPESVTDRPTRSHEYIFLLTKAQRYYYDQEAVREVAEYGRREWKGKHFKEGNIAISHMGTTGGGNPATGRNRRSVWTIATQPYPEAHFATFPEKLVEPCILAGTSEHGNCARCGKPWERVVEKTRSFESGSGKAGNKPQGKWADHPEAQGDLSDDIRAGPTIATETTGWQPTCQCDADTVPGIVLDPFAGSGIVGLVAQKLGRRAVLVEASEDYCELARRRLEREPLPLLAQGNTTKDCR